MNLTHDPWMPVIAADGRKRLVSLRDLFASAHEIRDLSVKPHEKIALLRLLICITQAALDGPENLDSWEMCRDGIQPAAQRYLEQWQACVRVVWRRAALLAGAGIEGGEGRRRGKSGNETRPDTGLR